MRELKSKGRKFPKCGTDDGIFKKKKRRRRKRTSINTLLLFGTDGETKRMDQEVIMGGPVSSPRLVQVPLMVEVHVSLALLLLMNCSTTQLPTPT